VDLSETTLINHHNAVLNEWKTRYDNLTDRLFESRLKNIDTLVDIGANTGGAIEFILNKTKVNHIFAFEPVLENYQLLNKNLDIFQKNHNFKFQTYQKAVYYGQDKVEVWGIDDNTGGMFPRNVKEEGFLQLHNRVGFSFNTTFDCTTLENELKHIDKVDLCKIDVEGSEWNILKNSEFIKNKVNTILLEYHWFDEEKTYQFVLENLPMFDVKEVCYSTFWLERKK
jgi:FkbM family methyltransferase